MLEEILRVKEEEVKQIKLEKHGNHVPKRSFYDALKNPKRFIGLIAEIKKASPSKGLIQQNFNHETTALQYEKAGADCLSVLTDERFFKGHKTYLQDVKRLVNIPILRKDFIIDEIQIEESKQIGADAILLIAEALSPKKLKALHEVAMSYELDVLVEVHSNTSLQRILDQFTPKIIGINNRDLTSFHTTVEHTEKIISNVPKESIVVSESGIFTKEDLDFVFKCGANAVLVGESLMRKSNQCQAIHELFGENVNVK
ncbi:indole-3-glycerol phosphate synthase TrpC [Bacillus kexueae]|uniref:indole-3-glycerol phosphate synthase TrpC n=1 Tax=Aeribacillus kexueae TaxID=2078952 RepID=UPI001FAEA442|nr:indole-3-glycerol phosphate synthase TrpC [Bacillus kexueae]